MAKKKAVKSVLGKKKNRRKNREEPKKIISNEKKVSESVIEPTSSSLKSNQSKAEPMVKSVTIAKPAFKLRENALIKSFDRFWNNQKLRRPVVAVLIGLLAIAVYSTTALYIIPEKILSQTIDKVNARKEEERRLANERDKIENQQRIENEGLFLNFSENKNWQIGMTFNEFGEIKIDLKEEFAPKTVENFVRLVYREYYNGVPIHRIVKEPRFAVIQGGDRENRNGSGGRSAFYLNETEQGQIPDEIWLEKPQFKVEGQETVLTNQPILRYPDLYTGFNPSTGSITYRKGLILMAKTSAPNSAGSQFFITLKDTELPAEYTAFGVITEDSMGVLDNIFNQIDPTISEDSLQPGQPIQQDGQPNKDLFIESTRIISPSL